MANYSRSLNLSKRSTAIVLLIVAVVCGETSSVRSQDRFSEYDLTMFERPTLPQGESSVRVPSGLVELWLRALERPDAELQRMVIDTLAIAHRRGIQVADAQPRMLELLGEPNQRLDVLRALAQTLVVIDARDQAESLAALSSRKGLSISQIVEPALARWKSPAMQETWLKRVSEASSGQTLMTLAIDGLGELQSDRASDPLERVLRNTGESIKVRRCAARALGKINSSGLIGLAQSLIDMPSRPGELNSLLAVELLARHDDPDSVELLTTLVSHNSTVVQSRSLARLFSIDIDLVDRHADVLISSPDANVRRWCARAMIGKQDVGRIQMLCSLLDDVNPSLRREVADGLVKLGAMAALDDEVLLRTTEVLRGNAWRGCEQAIVVLTKLDHKPSGERMVELLGHERGDVQVASAWGLTRLRVEKLLPGMLDHAQSVFEGFRARQLHDNMPGVSLHIAHLFIAFGDQRFRESNSLLRKYLPKTSMHSIRARAAAAWALGMVYEDDLQADLTPILLQRLNDVESETPEADEVRAMCAITLGRMKAVSALPDLRKFASSGFAGGACYWAIERMTGETPPPPSNTVGELNDWFLAPIRDE